MVYILGFRYLIFTDLHVPLPNTKINNNCYLMIQILTTLLFIQSGPEFYKGN